MEENTFKGAGGRTVSAKGCIGSCEGKVVLDVILKLDITGSTNGLGCEIEEQEKNQGNSTFGLDSGKDTA